MLFSVEMQEIGLQYGHYSVQYTTLSTLIRIYKLRIGITCTVLPMRFRLKGNCSCATLPSLSH